MAESKLEIRIGGKYRIHYPDAESGRPNVNNKIIHVRGIVDGQIVFRWWCPVKRWTYQIEDIHYFTCHDRSGYIKDIGNG
jgi:hypothetical protein